MTVIGTTLLLITLGIYNHFNFLVCPYGLRCFIIVHFSLQYASVCSSLVGSNFQYPAHAYLAEETLHRSHPWSHVSLFIAQSHFWSLEKITAQHSSWSVLIHPFFSLFPSPNFCFFWSDQLMFLHLYKCLMLSGQDCHMYLAFVLGNYPQSYAILPPFQTQHTWWQSYITLSRYNVFVFWTSNSFCKCSGLLICSFFPIVSQGGTHSR